MNTVMYYICYPLGYLMKWCWELFGNYGIAVIFFTLLTKFVILPLSVWVHRNSIRMVKIQPEVNGIKARYYGDSERIAEEETALYKKVRYSPFVSIVPLAVQILLLMCVVYIIKEPLTHILHLPEQVIRELAGALSVDYREGQLAVVRAVGEGVFNTAVLSDEAAAALPAIYGLDLSFLGFGLDAVASEVWGKYILVPVIAGLSSLLLCYVQNAVNVLQVEQSAFSKYSMTVFSVGLSLSLGFFVYCGVALYWVASNMFAIVQQLILNCVIDPKKHVDYAQLEASRAALAEIEALGADKKSAGAKRERADYKRFFKVVNRHLVIYSEKSGFYKYFEAIIDGLLTRSNITIHYVTSDPDDAVFELSRTQPRIRAYYIGQKRLITLMMKMDADMVLMTTPDLDNFYIKRSLLRKDTEYIYVPHDMMSIHMGFRKGALDHFDTVFCTGRHAEREIRLTEQIYGLPEKKTVHFGYPLTEKLIASYLALPKKKHGTSEILIAPSWQNDNILDSCVCDIIDRLMCDEYHITVRPHPEYVKRYSERLKQLTDRYADVPAKRLSFELDFTTNRSSYLSDLLITDWSGIAYEFCFATKKPVLFINTEMKVTNPEWERIPSVPMEIYLRDRVGVSLEKSEMCRVKDTVAELLSAPQAYEKKITDILNDYLFSPGSNGAEGVTYILHRLREMQNAKNSSKEK